MSTQHALQQNCRIYLIFAIFLGQHTFNSEAPLPFDLDVDTEVWPAWQLEGSLLWKIQWLPLLCNCVPLAFLLMIVIGLCPQDKGYIMIFRSAT